MTLFRDGHSVTWQNLSTDWQMTSFNLLALASMGLLMKAVAFARPLRVAKNAQGVFPLSPHEERVGREPERGEADKITSSPQPSPPFSMEEREKKCEPSQHPRISSRSLQFIFSPVLAPNSLERSQPLSAMPSILRRAGVCLGGLLLYYWIYWKLVDAFQLHGIILNYLVIPAVLLMTEVFVAIVTILWLPSGRLLPVLHRNPFAARSVADFWGRRWNLWMSDWFRYAMFAPLRRRPVLAVWLIFFLSGILHEYVLNLGLWLVTGKNLFGTMMIYFLLQAVGVLMERRFLKHRPLTNRLFTWLIVLAPVPLAWNESMLRTLHLWPK
ncbi:MAG TPA: MBOAT family protein [Verrucomicrobiae bacterium]|nr:MBOAT family protein [Verrucomicrobiae bacterium]